MTEGVSIDNNSSITSKSKYDINMQLLDPNNPISLWGLKRQSERSIEDLEAQINSLKEKVEHLEKEMNHSRSANHQSSSKLGDDEFNLSDGDQDSSYNDSSLYRTKSGKLQTTTDIAYLYSVPLVYEKNGKIESMGIPIDHNAEIEDILDGLENSHKMINFRMEAATIDSLNTIITIKPKIVHLSCHGDYDKKGETYFLAFESKQNFGMMDKLTENRLKTLFQSQKTLK